MSFCLIILAGGNSHRFRSNIGKPYQKIAGKSLIEINIDKARKIKAIKNNSCLCKKIKRGQIVKTKKYKVNFRWEKSKQSAFGIKTFDQK